MLMDLPACAGYLTAAAAVAAAARHRPAPGWPGVLRTLAHGWAEAAVERERRATLALVIACLPPGCAVTDRDPCGRERFIGPVGAAPVRGALR